MSIQLNPGTSGIDMIETIDNPERGCGYMEDGKAYLKADTGPGGILPAFVEFESPIPFKENRKRSYTRFPGIQFELSVTGSGGMTQTIPKGEVWAHLDRLDGDRPSGETAGEMVEFQSQDLLLSVGKTHYPDVEDFVDEAKVHGVSKAISVTSGNQPPEVNPGRTRLFLIHPNAVEVERDLETTAGEMEDDDELLHADTESDMDVTEIHDLDDDVPVEVHRTMTIPGIFGYTYLTRVVYTEDPDGNVPAYIQEYEQTGDLDIVRTGREVPYSEQEGFDEEGNLDEEAVIEGLHEAEDEIREFAENYTAAFSGEESIDLELQYPALEAPTIEDMDKAPYGELVERGTIPAYTPPDGEDYLDGEEDGALAIVSHENEMFKVVPSNILSIDDDERTATTQMGPYEVTVTFPLTGNRTVSVKKTR